LKLRIIRITVEEVAAHSSFSASKRDIRCMALQGLSPSVG